MRGSAQGVALAGIVMNADLQNMPVESFIKWLRDAFGHGDGRTIHPLHRHQGPADKTWLIGFYTEFQQQ